MGSLHWKIKRKKGGTCVVYRFARCRFWLSIHRDNIVERTQVLEQTVGSNPSLFNLQLCACVSVPELQFCCQYGKEAAGQSSEGVRKIEKTYAKVSNNALRHSCSLNAKSVALVGVECVDSHSRVCSCILQLPCLSQELSLSEGGDDVFNLLLWISTVPGTDVCSNVY